MGVSAHTQRLMADAAQLYLDGKLTQAALRARLQRLQREDEEASRRPEFDVGYYSGVADALDVIREHDFPDTTRVDLLADKLAPSTTRGAVERGA